MATNTVNGVTVLLELGDGNPIGGQTSASLSKTADTIEITCKDSAGYREYVSSWKTWTVDMDAFVCLGDTQQEALQTAYENGTEVSVYIEVGDSTTTGYDYTGFALVTDLSEEYGQDDAVTFTLSLQGTGVLTRG